MERTKRALVKNTTSYCDQCGKSYVNVYTMQAHKKAFHDKIKNFVCAYCDSRFVTKYKLQRHMQGVHRENRDFHCEICGSSFKTREMHVKHMRTHTKGLGPFECSKCQLTFKYKSGLDYHQIKSCDESRTKNKSKKDEAVKEVKTKNVKMIEYITISTKGSQIEVSWDQQLISNEENQPAYVEENVIEDKCEDEMCETIYEENLEQETIEELNNEMIEKVKRNFICDLCGNFFKLKSHLKRHYARQHSDKSDYKYSCSSCKNVKFLHKYDLQRHMLKHNPAKPFECFHCDKRFKTKSSLLSHIKVIHMTDRENEAKPFVCNVCDRKYKYRRHLEFHLRKHTDDRRYSCVKCDERFLYSDALKWHSIRNHAEPAPFVCDICSRKFIHKNSLVSHRKDHDINGSLAVNCPICLKKVSEKRHLKRHMRIHKEKSFICNQCNKSFQEKYQLTRHYSTHHS